MIFLEHPGVHYCALMFISYVLYVWCNCTLSTTILWNSVNYFGSHINILGRALHSEFKDGENDSEELTLTSVNYDVEIIYIYNLFIYIYIITL